MKEITERQILKFEKANNKYYSKAIGDALFSLNNSFYDILIEAFERSTDTFVIKGYGYNERLTELCGFDWFNTINYLRLIGIDDNVIEWVRHVMNEESKQFNWIFENASTALTDAKQKVINNDEYANFQNDYFVRLYSSFIDDLIHQVMNNYVPNVIKACQQLVDDEIDQDLLTKKLKDINYKTVSTVSSHTTSTLNTLLKEIYAKYGLSKEAKQSTSEGKKIPFSDFDKSKTLFKANFSDEELALDTLGLGKSATWEEIKKAYKKLAFQFHPDRNKSKYASAQMEKINSAYNLLKRKINN